MLKPRQDRCIVRADGRGHDHPRRFETAHPARLEFGGHGHFPAGQRLGRVEPGDAGQHPARLQSQVEDLDV